MATIKVRVQGEIATNLTPEVRLVCQNDKYDVEFEFDESWAKSNFKTALFICNGKLVPIPFDGNVCEIPALYETELLHIGVKSSDVEGLHTSTPARVGCLLSANDIANGEIPAPTQSVYDEIIELLNKYISGGGSIDLSDYQKKVDDRLETQSKEIVGAINEVKAVAETAKMVFGETEGTAYEGNKGKQNADNIEILKNELAVLNMSIEQSGIVKKYKQPITQEYNERKTADGLNVLDGSIAILTKVKGDTIASNNIINLEAIKMYASTKNIEIDNINRTISLVDLGQNGTTIRWEGVNAYENFSKCFPNLSVGTYFFKFNSTRSTPPTSWRIYAEGKEVFRLGNGSGSAFTITEDMISALKSATLAGSVISFLLYGTIGDVFSEIQITKGEKEKPYIPYFEGLKSASFAGIESISGDKTKTSVLYFPKMATLLGTTIDFETKKITKEYDLLVKDIPFTEEQLSSYSDYIVSQDGKSICYKLATPIEVDFTQEQLVSGNTYIAYNGGTEKVIGNDEAEFVQNTITQDYILITKVD